MKGKKDLAGRGLTALLIAGAMGAVLALGPANKVCAAQTDGQKEIVSVDFPVFSEVDKSPFDFIIDPQGLINATNAVRYGGRSFEAGATLYFENADGEYDFSCTSDFLTITNRSSVPVRVSVKACIDNGQELTFSQDASFVGTQAHLYLALKDDRGNVLPFNEEGQAQLVYEMEASEESGCMVYSFGLTGACNPDADWERVLVKPHITVTWTVESIEEETVEAKEESGEAAEKTTEKETEEEEAAREESQEASEEEEDSGEIKDETPEESAETRENDETQDDTGTEEEASEESGSPEENSQSAEDLQEEGSLTENEGVLIN